MVRTDGKRLAMTLDASSAGDDDIVPSPCISICRMGSLTADATSVCTGCLRTIGEIVEWGNASNDRKREILQAIDARRPDG